MSASASPEPIELKILGQKISVRSPDTDPELVREVIQVVSRKLEEAEARAKGSTVGPHQITLIALLEIAEEYVKSRGRFLDYQAEVEAKADALATAIDQIR